MLLVVYPKTQLPFALDRLRISELNLGISLISSKILLTVEHAKKSLKHFFLVFSRFFSFHILQNPRKGNERQEEEKNFNNFFLWLEGKNMWRTCGSRG
jgi:hypothetical protein